MFSSAASVAAAREAARSRIEVPSTEWLEISLPALFRLAFEFDWDWRPEIADTEVRLVPADSEAESRELVVGVLV